MRIWQAVANQISEATGETVVFRGVRPLGGGCINRAVALASEAATYFIKHNRPEQLETFVAEAEGLRALRATGTLRVPAPICWGIVENRSFLALEYVEIAAPGALTQEQLGRRLAALHRTTHTHHGWHRDNTIGSTAQHNRYTETWVEFLREHRLGPQFELAGRNGHRTLAQRGQVLLLRLDALVANHRPQPSLLHGDLWSGNYGALPNGEPVVFDPAVYYGDRETDIAMTELFGGFSDRFYAAYREAWPLPAGYEQRRTLYNLYHMVNHVNLFGGSYLNRATTMLERALTETA